MFPDNICTEPWSLCIMSYVGVNNEKTLYYLALNYDELVRVLEATSKSLFY